MRGNNITYPTMIFNKMTAVMTAPSMKSWSEKDKTMVISRTIVKLFET